MGTSLLSLKSGKKNPALAVSGSPERGHLMLPRTYTWSVPVYLPEDRFFTFTVQHLRRMLDLNQRIQLPRTRCTTGLTVPPIWPLWQSSSYGSPIDATCRVLCAHTLNETPTLGPRCRMV